VILYPEHNEIILLFCIKNEGENIKDDEKNEGREKGGENV